MKRLLIALAAMALVLAACGGGSKSTGSSSASSTTQVNHQAVLAEGETPAIASQLVQVAGYHYADISKDEASAVMDKLRAAEQKAGAELFAAVSFHGVVATDRSQNTARTGEGTSEVGFLQLFEFSEAPPPGIDEQLMTTALGPSNKLIERLTISGVPVFLFEDSSSKDSRFTFAWLRHGVGGAFDGADRSPLERWLRAYLAEPALVPGETGPLSAFLVPVAGYAYANLVTPESDAVARAIFGDSPFSLHQVTDSQGAIGTVMLAQVPTSMTTDQLGAAIQAQKGIPFVPATPATVAGKKVAHLTSPEGDAFAVSDNGMAVVLVGGNPEKASQFLNSFLSAKR